MERELGGAADRQAASREVSTGYEWPEDPERVAGSEAELNSLDAQLIGMKSSLCYVASSEFGRPDWSRQNARVLCVPLPGEEVPYSGKICAATLMTLLLSRCWV